MNKNELERLALVQIRGMNQARDLTEVLFLAAKMTEAIRILDARTLILTDEILKRVRQMLDDFKNELMKAIQNKLEQMIMDVLNNVLNDYINNIVNNNIKNIINNNLNDPNASFAGKVKVNEDDFLEYLAEKFDSDEGDISFSVEEDSETHVDKKNKKPSTSFNIVGKLRDSISGKVMVNEDDQLEYLGEKFDNDEGDISFDVIEGDGDEEGNPTYNIIGNLRDNIFGKVCVNEEDSPEYLAEKFDSDEGDISFSVVEGEGDEEGNPTFDIIGTLKDNIFGKVCVNEDDQPEYLCEKFSSDEGDITFYEVEGEGDEEGNPTFDMIGTLKDGIRGKVCVDEKDTPEYLKEKLIDSETITFEVVSNGAGKDGESKLAIKANIADGVGGGKVLVNEDDQLEYLGEKFDMDEGHIRFDVIEGDANENGDPTYNIIGFMRDNIMGKVCVNEKDSPEYLKEKLQDSDSISFEVISNGADESGNPKFAIKANTKTSASSLVSVKEDDTPEYLKEKVQGSESIKVEVVEKAADSDGKKYALKLSMEDSFGGKVKIDKDDTHPDFLKAKLKAGEGISITAENETLKIDNTKPMKELEEGTGIKIEIKNDGKIKIINTKPMIELEEGEGIKIEMQDTGKLKIINTKPMKLPDGEGFIYKNADGTFTLFEKGRCDESLA